jgi:alpha-glucosidase
MPLDTVHRIEGDGFTPRTASHAEIHNVYGMENSRATHDGELTLRPNVRPFVMTRASYAGGQRYAVTWTGDNSSTWDHLKLAVQQMLNLGLSGFAWSGADIPGFTGGASPDLATRWFEIGAFEPVFRGHSQKDTPRAEPWVDGPEQLAIRRRFIDERYRLMPYLYGLAEENSRTGDPLMRPVFYDYPDAASAECDQSMAFTLGKALLIAPPPKMESPERYDVCLPAGGWFDYWTGKRVDAAKVTETPKLDSLPVFVRAGTILPRQPLVQSTSETPKGPLRLDVYPGPDCAGALYLDDGHSMDFEKGGYLRQKIRCATNSTGRLSIIFEPRDGNFQPWWSTIDVVVHDRSPAESVRSSTLRVAKVAKTAAGTIEFTVHDAPAGGEIVVADRP